MKQVQRTFCYCLVLAMMMLSYVRLDCLAIDPVPPTFFSSVFLDFLLAVIPPGIDFDLFEKNDRQGLSYTCV